MIYLRLCLLGLLLGGGSQAVQSQPANYTTANAHAHNDYEHPLPFYEAYARQFGSIEVDVWAVNDTLFVAHDRDQVRAGRTLQSLYIEPLVERLEINDGKAYANGQPLQLLIDLKSSYRKVMPLLEKELERLRPYAGPAVEKPLRIVISGSMPPPDSLHRYDPIFTFDGRLGTNYPTADLQRVTLVSANVQELVSWDAGKPMGRRYYHDLQEVVDSLHQHGKLVRFWATPDTEQAYRTLADIGVDYIGTDHLFRLERWLRQIEE